MILGCRPLSYLRRRLSLPLGRSILLGFAQLTEAFVLMLFLEPDFFLPILSIRILAGIFSSMSWGVTEGLRVELRALRAAQDLTGAQQRLEVALGRAVGIAGAILLGTLALIGPGLVVGEGTVVDAFALALACKTGVGLVGRTVQSGPGATRRVFRPPWSLLGPDVLDSVALIAFWWWLGPWAVAVALLTAAIVQGSVAIAFAWRAMADDPIRPQRLRFHLPSPQLVGRVCAYGTAGLSLALPSGMVLSIILEQGDIPLMLLLYALRPMADVVQSVPRLYLIDTLRILPLGPGPRRVLNVHIALAIGVAIGSLAFWTTLAWLTGPSDLPLTSFLLFLLFTFFSSIFAMTVVPPLLAGRIGAVLIGAVLAALPIALIRPFDLDPLPALALASLGSTLGASFLWRLRGVCPERPWRARPIPLLDLLSLALDRSGELLLLQTRAPFPARRAGHLAKALAEDPTVRIARVGRRHNVIWCEEPFDRAALEPRMAGLGEVVASARGPQIAAQILRWADEPDVPESLRAALRTAPVDRATLHSQLSHLVSRVIWKPGSGRLPGRIGTAFAPLARSIRKGRSGRPSRALEAQGIDMAALHGSAGVEAIALFPSSDPAAARTEARTLIWRASIARILG
ncbi:MAG: hypothetical protein EA397_18160 [Deltaproteobacteria bacterium]|nr:MAG: hypothetical protein EA397_18160 [Deltaproteobacteria bacterium]